MSLIQPDISAPGVNILAAYSPDALESPGYDYFILSGTSMSAPHVAGVAAYVRTFHPHWSPSAIKSAIMTTGKFFSLYTFLVVVLIHLNPHFFFEFHLHTLK